MKARKTTIERWVASKEPCGEIRQPLFEMRVVSESLEDMRFFVPGLWHQRCFRHPNIDAAIAQRAVVERHRESRSR